MNLFHTLCLTGFLLCTYVNGYSQSAKPIGKNTISKYLRPSISLHTGISIPFGKFRQSTDWHDQTSSAQEGLMTEMSASLFPRKFSRWQTSVLLGFMYNPYTIPEEQRRGLQDFQSSDWHVGYGMLGLSYTSPTRLYVGLDAYVGLLLFNGGNIQFNEQSNHTRYIQKSYQYPIQTHIAIKGGFRIGYKVAERLKFDAFAQMMFAPSYRKGQYKQSHYMVSRSSEELVYVHEENIHNQTSIMTINVGISLHYLLVNYKTEDQLYAMSDK